MSSSQSHSVMKKVLLGELYQFPILEHIGDFLMNKKLAVRHPVFLRAVCKTTDHLIRSDDTVWKRLLKHRLSTTAGTADAEGKKKPVTLRPEAKRITGAYERWLVHTAFHKSVHEKWAYSPTSSKQLQFHKLNKQIGFLLVDVSYIRNVGGLLGPVGVNNHMINRHYTKIKRLESKIKDLVSGGHRHHRQRSLRDMIESGKILRVSVLPLVQGLVEASKAPKKPAVPKTKAMITAALFKELPKFV